MWRLRCKLPWIRWQEIITWELGGWARMKNKMRSRHSDREQVPQLTELSQTWWWQNLSKKSHHHCWNEILSLHHTSPWFFGQFCIAICHGQLPNLFRTVSVPPSCYYTDRQGSRTCWQGRRWSYCHKPDTWLRYHGVWVGRKKRTRIWWLMSINCQFPYVKSCLSGFLSHFQTLSYNPQDDSDIRIKKGRMLIWWVHDLCITSMFRFIMGIQYNENTSDNKYATGISKKGRIAHFLAMFMRKSWETNASNIPNGVPGFPTNPHCHGDSTGKEEWIGRYTICTFGHNFWEWKKIIELDMAHKWRRVHHWWVMFLMCICTGASTLRHKNLDSWPHLQNPLMSFLSRLGPGNYNQTTRSSNAGFVALPFASPYSPGEGRRRKHQNGIKIPTIELSVYPSSILSRISTLVGETLDSHWLHPHSCKMKENRPRNGNWSHCSHCMILLVRSWVCSNVEVGFSILARLVKQGFPRSLGNTKSIWRF